jgi:hypothetical protein
MNIENDYDKEVYNGDIGTIQDVDPDAGELIASFDSRPVSLKDLANSIHWCPPMRRPFTRARGLSIQPSSSQCSRSTSGGCCASRLLSGYGCGDRWPDNSRCDNCRGRAWPWMARTGTWLARSWSLYLSPPLLVVAARLLVGSAIN